MLIEEKMTAPVAKLYIDDIGFVLSQYLSASPRSCDMVRAAMSELSNRDVQLTAEIHSIGTIARSNRLGIMESDSDFGTAMGRLCVRCFRELEPQVVADIEARNTTAESKSEVMK